MITARNMGQSQRAILAFDLTLLRELSRFNEAAHSELLGKLFEVREAYETFIASTTMGKIEALEAEHDIVAEQCFNSNNAVAEANLNLSRFFTEVQRLNSELSDAQFKLRQIQRNEPQPPFATRAAVQRWKSDVAKAQAAIETAMQKQRDTLIRQAGFENDVSLAKELFRELSGQEQTLRLEIQRLKGEKPEPTQQPYANEFGLSR